MSQSNINMILLRIFEFYVILMTFSVCFFIPYPSEPNKSTIFPFHSIFVKSSLLFVSNPYTQKLLSLKYFKVVFILETVNIFRCSMHPLEDLYINLLFAGKCLSLNIKPSILNDAALLIIDPMFLGSVTSSRQTKVRLFFFLIKFFNSNFSKFSISKISPNIIFCF